MLANSIGLFSVSLDCRSVSSGPRPQESRGSWEAARPPGEVVGEAAERGDAPEAPPKPSPFPRFPRQGAGQGPGKASHP